MTGRRQAQIVTRVTDLLFVYGTLRSGRENHGFLAPWALTAGPARADGLALFTDGRYPYAWPADAPGARVEGEVVRLSDPDLALAALDRFEGPGYRRARIEVRTASGARCDAWAYLAARAPEGCGLRPLEDSSDRSIPR